MYVIFLGDINTFPSNPRYAKALRPKSVQLLEQYIFKAYGTRHTLFCECTLHLILTIYFESMSDSCKTAFLCLPYCLFQQANGFLTAFEYSEKRKNVFKVSTGSIEFE